MNLNGNEFTYPMHINSYLIYRLSCIKCSISLSIRYPYIRISNEKDVINKIKVVCNSKISLKLLQ